ncbi:MAG TPA: EAL domain-containing protein, partial [Bacillota bacterium]|nr:EAL domain-containing protein [Bacillota bacterium]
ELIGQNHRIINSGYHPHSFFKCMWRTIGRGETWNGEVRNKAKDGTYYWMNTTIVPVLNCDKKPEQYISIRSDITDRVQAENELKAVMQNDFKKVVKNLENWVFKVVKDKDNFFISLSEGKLAKLLNLETAYVRDRPFVNLLNSDNEKELKDIIEKAFSGRVISRELAFGDRHLNMTLSPVTTDGNIVEVVGSVIDMTKRKKAEDMIYYMAHYDTLTGLINRAHFTSLLRKEIKKAKEMDETFTILFIDLDRFKSINDSLGHITGDKVLRKVTKFFKQTFREQDIISRQGGDEFIALLPNTNRKQAKEITKNIFKQLAKPFKLEHFDLYVSASIGISSFPKDGTNEELLIKNADAAMYEAKKSGKNTFKFYTKDLHDSIISRIHLENDLRKAIDYGELELYYQPKMNIIDGEINGVEALVRWNHPKHGLVPPDQFIFIAEETGLIVRIGEWVLKEACRQTKKWQEHNFPNLSVAVNISLRQFLQNDLHETIAEALEESGLDPKFLEIEITESMTSDANHTIESLNKIKALGVQVSIDDFGTGYSSLSYLSKFPVDRLKIDKSFVMNLSDNNKAIIKSIIDVANNLNIKIIAEGVETEEHVQFLASQNCSEAQGFYFSRPLPVRKLEKKFKTVRL